MKIRNESKRTYCFNGGTIQPNEVVDIKDEAIANALIINYPNELICLDALETRVIEAKEVSKESSEEKLTEKAEAKEVSKIKVKVH